MDEEKIDYAEKVRRAINASPYYKLIGAEVLENRGGKSKVVMDFREEYCNVHGVAHGGVLASMVDFCCGLSLSSYFGENESAVTIDLRINYFAPFRKGRVTGYGKVTYRGKQTAVTEAEIFDEEGNMLAKGINTHFVINHVIE